MTIIKVLKDKDLTNTEYKKHLADCVVLTQDNKILLQYRVENQNKEFGCINLFGGHVEKGETPLQGMLREIQEELGAKINPSKSEYIGSITEEWTNHREVVHVFFWHDVNGDITGCYEGETKAFENVESILKHPQVMDYAKWSIQECSNKGLLVT